MQRLHGVRLSAATVHKVLVQHELNVLPTRKRARHKPKRYKRPVPGDRVQMDTCKISTYVGGQPLLIVWSRRNAPLGGPMLPKHAADPALRQSQLVSNVVDAGAAARGA